MNEPRREPGRSLIRALVLIAVVAGLGGWLWHDVLRDRFIPKRWGVVEPGLIYRSGQLSPALVEDTLRDHGIRVVVDLNQPDPASPAQVAEEEAARRLSIERAMYPLQGDGTGDIESYAQAIAAIHRARMEQKPVLVHCAAGAYRTGGVVACYDMLVRGVAPARALDDMIKFDWDPDDPRLPAYINNHIDELARRLVELKVIERMPEPLPVLQPGAQDRPIMPDVRQPAHVWLVPALAFAIVLACSSWRLGDSPLSGTEGHRAIPAHQMVQSGQWLIPSLYGEPYLAKPPLHYWVLAGVERLAGFGAEWLWRLPSAIGTACLAAFLCVIAARWFGAAAGPASALAFLGLIPLWSQSRNADIDSLHTLATTMAALGLLEIGCGNVRLRWASVLGIGGAVGAAFLLKGPSALPILLACVVAPAIVRGQPRVLLRGSLWGAAFIGVATFSLWVVAAYFDARSRGSTLDLSGLTEVARNLADHRWARLGEALSLPLIVLAYSLPVALVVPLAFSKPLAAWQSDSAREQTRSLALAFLLALLISMLARVHNPRYLYPALPLLCPLAGAVAAAWAGGAFSPLRQRRLRQVMSLWVIGLVIGHGVLTILVARNEAPPAGDHFLGRLISGILAISIGAWVLSCWMRRRASAGAWGIALQLCLLAIPFSEFRNLERRAQSSMKAGLALRERVGEQPVAAGFCVLNSPELFYYAGVEVRFHRRGVLDASALEPGQWVVLMPEEWDSCLANPAARFDDVVLLPTRSNSAILTRCTATPASAADDPTTAAAPIPPPAR